MTNKEVSKYVAIGRRRGIEWEEVYCSDAPAHWPRDRCFVPESDERYAKRVKAKLKRQRAK